MSDEEFKQYTNKLFRVQSYEVHVTLYESVAEFLRTGKWKRTRTAYRCPYLDEAMKNSDHWKRLTGQIPFPPGIGDTQRGVK